MSQPPFGPPPHGQPSQYPPPPPFQYGPPPGQYGQTGAVGWGTNSPQYGPPHQYTPVSVAPQQGPSLGWGPSFGPPGGPGFQPGWGPPPKKSKAPLFAILGVVLIAVAGLWAWGVIRKNADDNYTPARPTFSPTTTYPTYSPTSSEPTDDPTTTEPTSTSTGKPQPRPIDIAAKNPIYRVGQMKPPNCREPTIRPNTNGNAGRYWAAIKPCLDRGWAPMITKAGFRFRPPGMTYWAGTSTTSPCGGGVINVPFYCSANHMMYMKVDVFAKTYNEYPGAADKAYARIWYSRSIAHEYGHAMQEVTGILDASNRLEYEASSAAKRLEYSRRLELQANCFAGMFLAVNKRSYPINGLLLYAWNRWVITSGQPPYQGTHGSKASQKRFMGVSFKTGNPINCNTYNVSPANVS